MARQITRMLAIKFTDLDPTTHRTLMFGREVGVKEVTIDVSQVDGGHSKPVVSRSGTRVYLRNDGTPGAQTGKLYLRGRSPEWMRPFIAEALAEFEAMTKAKQPLTPKTHQQQGITMSDLPLSVDEIRGSAAQFETLLDQTKAAIAAAEDDDTVDLAGMCELLQERNRITSMIVSLRNLADDQDLAA